MNYESAIAWVSPIIGCLVVLLIALRVHIRSQLKAAVVGAVLSAAVGIILVFLAALLNGQCISMRLCQSHGDGNLAYWFHSVGAVPVYWLIFLLANLSQVANEEEPSKASTPTVAATEVASTEAQLGQCPNCSMSIPLTAAECPKCKAMFGSSSGWQVKSL